MNAVVDWNMFCQFLVIIWCHCLLLARCICEIVNISIMLQVVFHQILYALPHIKEMLLGYTDCKWSLPFFVIIHVSALYSIKEPFGSIYLQSFGQLETPLYLLLCQKLQINLHINFVSCSTEDCAQVGCPPVLVRRNFWWLYFK